MRSMTTGAERASSPIQSERAVVRFQAACKEAGVSVSTMRRLIRAGRGPRLLRLSERCLGVRRGDLNEWLNSRET